VAPEWQWAEIGSVLRKKVRRSLLTADEAQGVWDDFLRLPIEAVGGRALASRAWDVARLFDLPTLYDAAMLACVDVASAPDGTAREFWTADAELVRRLGSDRPASVRVLGGR